MRNEDRSILGLIENRITSPVLAWLLRCGVLAPSKESDIRCGFMIAAKAFMMKMSWRFHALRVTLGCHLGSYWSHISILMGNLIRSSQCCQKLPLSHFFPCAHQGCWSNECNWTEMPKIAVRFFKRGTHSSGASLCVTPTLELSSFSSWSLAIQSCSEPMA